MRKATVKASVRPLTPKAEAMNRSRTNPVMRDTRVSSETVEADLKSDTGDASDAHGASNGRQCRRAAGGAGAAAGRAEKNPRVQAPWAARHDRACPPPARPCCAPFCARFCPGRPASAGAGRLRQRTFPYADLALPHRGPDGFRNIGSDARPGGSAPWYEVLQRRWRGDLPSGPPEGGYAAFAERWRQPLKPSTLEVGRQPHAAIAWLGHAGLWLQAGGQRVLIDPQLSSFAGPVSWLASRA